MYYLYIVDYVENICKSFELKLRFFCLILAIQLKGIVKINFELKEIIIYMR